MRQASRTTALVVLLVFGYVPIARADILPSFPAPEAVETTPMLLVSALLAVILARVSYVQLRKMADTRTRHSHEGPE
jgi:hypothetical protein